MATAKQTGKKGKRPWGSVLLILLFVGALAFWFYGDRLTGPAQAATGFGAKVACSCRHVGGRDLGSCKDDFVPGMELVFLSEDEEEQSVTAYVPLFASDTARYHEGFGCMLDPWQR